jgi:biopolymer transport protein ExbD
MSMNVGGGKANADPEPMMEVNMTPLIDVMLVLIIMFIVTIPVQNHAVNLNMPTGNPPPVEKPPPVVDILIDFDGTIYWNNVVIDQATLEAKFAGIATEKDQPEVHLRPNKLAKYKSVAAVMAAAQRLGVTKIGMVGNEQFL